MTATVERRTHLPLNRGGGGRRRCCLLTPDARRAPRGMLLLLLLLRAVMLRTVVVVRRPDGCARGRCGGLPAPVRRRGLERSAPPPNERRPELLLDLVGRSRLVVVTASRLLVLVLVLVLVVLLPTTDASDAAKAASALRRTWLPRRRAIRCAVRRAIRRPRGDARRLLDARLAAAAIE